MSTIYFTFMNSEERDSEELPFNPVEKHVRPLIGKPIEIGRFSVDAKRAVHFDDSKMKYLVLPPRTGNLYLDLNVNFDIDTHHQYVTLEKMHHTLQWLLHIQGNKSHSASHLLQANLDFVTVRGTLKLITCTPYLKGFYRQEWEICATKFEGTIYFTAIDTDAEIEENKNLSQRQALLQAWGYKFEQYMTADTIDGECNIDSKTFQAEEYCVVVKNVLDNYSLVYTAEVDAVIPHRYPGPGSGNTSCYTELKTSRSIINEGQNYYFHRYKLVTWWAQSFLVGIPEIICGLRDDEGIVKKVEVLTVSTIPEKALGLWSPDACLSFCAKFLDFLKRTVIEDNSNIVYKFHYRGDDTIYCTKLINPSPRYKVIPQWYVKSRLKDFNVTKN